VNKCCSSLVFHLKPEILGRPNFLLSSYMAQTTYKVKKLGGGAQAGAQRDDLISLLLFLQNKESMLKTTVKVWWGKLS
jgi:hypothetical protein